MPNIEVGRFLGPKGSGDGSRGDDEGGRAPQAWKEISSKHSAKVISSPALTNGDNQPAPSKGDGQLNPNEEGGNMEKEEEEKKSQAWWSGASMHRVSIFKGSLKNVLNDR